MGSFELCCFESRPAALTFCAKSVICLRLRTSGASYLPAKKPGIHAIFCEVQKHLPHTFRSNVMSKKLLRKRLRMGRKCVLISLQESFMALLWGPMKNQS